MSDAAGYNAISSVWDGADGALLEKMLALLPCDRAGAHSRRHPQRRPVLARLDAQGGVDGH